MSRSFAFRHQTVHLSSAPSRGKQIPCLYAFAAVAMLMGPPV